MRISIYNIIERERSINKRFTSDLDINIHTLLEYSHRTKSSHPIEKIIENWRELDTDENRAFDTLLDAVSEYCIKANQSDTNKILNIFKESLINIQNLKRVKGQIEFKNRTTNVFDEVIKECELHLSCDRVLKNQSVLDKKIDMNNIIKENSISQHITILELCEAIDQFNIDLDIKFNLCLENIMYKLHQNHMVFDRQNVLETVTNYFLSKDLSDDTIDNLRFVIEETLFFDEKDKSNLSFLVESKGKNNKVRELLNKFKLEKVKTPQLLKTLINKIYTESANNIIDEIPNFFSWIRQFLVFSTIAINPYLGIISICIDKFIQMSLQRKETDRFLSKLNKELDKANKELSSIKDSDKKKRLEQYVSTLKSNIDKLETYRDSLYSEKELERMNEMSLESFLGEDTISLNDYFNSYHNNLYLEYLNSIKILNTLGETKYKNLIKSNVLIPCNNTDADKFKSSNQSTIQNYISQDNRIFICLGDVLPLNIQSDNQDKSARVILDDITEYLENRTNDGCNVIYDGGDDLYHIYLTFVIPIKQEEVKNENTIHLETVKDLSLILSLEESINSLSTNDRIINIVESNIDKYGEETISLLTEFSEFNPSLLHPEELSNTLSKFKTRLYSSDRKDKYSLGSTIAESVYRLSETRGKKKVNSRYDIINEFIITDEVVTALNSVNEMSFMNNIKIARDKLQKNAMKLSDKEKMMSRQLDNSLAKFTEKIQKELSSKNREAVIKGTIVPSASSIIKIAITSGVLYLVNPALSVISIIGGIAASKVGTRKEKQFILDEIDIQLKLVEKKIQLAESNNDMKSLEQLLKIEQKLKREKQRILYRLKNYYPVSTNHDR